MLQVTPVPAFEDNYVWLIRDPAMTHVVIVDPGDEEPVITALDEEGLQPVAVLVTHHHFDHVAGISELVARYPKLAVYGPAREAISGLTVRLREGDLVEIPALGARFEVLDVPGHTAGHIAYYGEGLVFCGDTLFACGCGRLFEGTPEQMSRSLDKLAALPGETLAHCAHEYTLANIGFAKWVEPENADLLARGREATERRRQGLPTVPSSLALERQTNPFLRTRETAVRAAAERYAGRSLPTPAEVFGVIRAWKDRDYD
jgi:hydroxyacylglutathione hydrolase